MKKVLVLLSIFAIAAGLVAFVPKSENRFADPTSQESSMSATRSVSVCMIKYVGSQSGMTSTNCNFSGKYDTEDNYIVVYNSRGKQVASGTPQYNRDSTGKRSNYKYVVSGIYYFNL